MEKTKDDLLLMQKNYQDSYQIQMDAITELERKVDSFCHVKIKHETITLPAHELELLKRQIQVRSEGLKELDEKIIALNFNLNK